MQLTPARFDRPSNTWRAAPTGGAAQTRRLTCATFNVWFGEHAFERRAAALLALLAGCDADVIALQEVTPPLLERLLAAEWVRASYAVSDDSGATVWPYGTLLLTRWTPARISSHPLPSQMGRRLLVAELELNGARTAVASVHLESLRASAEARGEQLARIFPLLAPAPHALLMGDFNFCSSWAEENARLDPAYSDVWPALRPNEPGYTEDTAVNTMRLQQTGRQAQVRFDRVLLRSSPPGWAAESIRLLGDAPVGPGEPTIFTSDHFGLLASFRWQGPPDRLPGDSHATSPLPRPGS